MRGAAGALAFGALVATAATGLAGRGDAAAAPAPRTHQVTIQGLLYLPAMLDVKQGDTVVWVNKDPFPHTVTAPGAFDSGSIGAGASWRLVARRAGSFEYVCTLHSNMKASLRVD